MLEKKRSIMSPYQADIVIQECKKWKNKEDITSEDLMEFILGEKGFCNSGAYTLKRYSENNKRTVFNRINLIWVYPLFLVAIPFQWMISGDTGVNRNSKIGRIVDHLVMLDGYQTVLNGTIYIVQKTHYMGIDGEYVTPVFSYTTRKAAENKKDRLNLYCSGDGHQYDFVYYEVKEVPLVC